MSSISDPSSPSSPHPFTQELKRLRLVRGLTQEDLAAQAHIAVRSLKDIEEGKTYSMRPGTYKLYAGALHLSAEERKHLDALYAAFQAGLTAPVPLANEDDVSEKEAGAANAVMTQWSTIGTQLNVIGPTGFMVVSVPSDVASSLSPSSAPTEGLAGRSLATDGVILAYADAPSRVWTLSTPQPQGQPISPMHHPALHGLAHARAARLVALCVLLGLLLPFAQPQVSHGVALLENLFTTPQVPAPSTAASSTPASPSPSPTAAGTTPPAAGAIPVPCVGDSLAAVWHADPGSQVACQNGTVVLTSTQSFAQTRYKPATPYAWQSLHVQVTIAPPEGQTSVACQFMTSTDLSKVYGFAVRQDGQVTFGYSSPDGKSYTELTNGKVYVPVASAYTLVITPQNGRLHLFVNTLDIPFQRDKVHGGPVVLFTLAATNLAEGPVQASYMDVRVTGQ